MTRPRKEGGTGRGLPAKSVRLTPEQRKILKSLAQKAGKSESDIIRELIEEKRHK